MANLTLPWSPLILYSSTCGSGATNCANGGACTQNSQCQSGCCATLYDYWSWVHGTGYKNE